MDSLIEVALILAASFLGILMFWNLLIMVALAMRTSNPQIQWMQLVIFAVELAALALVVRAI